MMDDDIAQQMYGVAETLFPIHRSITGNGVRKTLHLIQQHLPGLVIHEVPSGTKAFDWEVPDEWNIHEAWIKDEDGNHVVDFKNNNLHVVSYSIPVAEEVSLNELQEHLYSLPELPEAIPYITSYYQPRWGFCLAHKDRSKLKDGRYRVYVDSSLEPGSLTYGELILPGRSPKEILLSTYICHPSMANNEVSGPVVTTFLAKWLQEIDWRYTFRIVFIPETIGSIVYLSRNLEQMRSQTIAGYVITCVGDDRAYSYLPSRQGDTLSDQVALHVLSRTAPDFKRYSFLDRGSDERQYCSPGADLPVASIMRSKYAEYPEYHTSLDDMSLISPEGLGGAYEVLKECLSIISGNYRYRNVMPCEPQLGKRGLYPTLSTRETKAQTREMMDLLAYSDGRHLMDIAETIGVPASRCIPLAEKLTEHGLLKRSGDDE